MKAVKKSQSAVPNANSWSVVCATLLTGVIGVKVGMEQGREDEVAHLQTQEIIIATEREKIDGHNACVAEMVDSRCEEFREDRSSCMLTHSTVLLPWCALYGSLLTCGAVSGQVQTRVNTGPAVCGQWDQTGAISLTIHCCKL